MEPLEGGLVIVRRLAPERGGCLEPGEGPLRLTCDTPRHVGFALEVLDIGPHDVLHLVPRGRRGDHASLSRVMRVRVEPPPDSPRGEERLTRGVTRRDKGALISLQRVKNLTLFRPQVIPEPVLSPENGILSHCPLMRARTELICDSPKVYLLRHRSSFVISL